MTENERQKLQSVLANMSEGVIATEKDGRISVINEAAEKLLGRSRTKLEDQYLLEFLDVEDKISHVSELQESGDRKSTRLNSSHVAISYAVFCLNKKIANKR